MLSIGSKYRGFTVTKSIEIPELQCQLIELKSEESGADVLYIHADDPENFFCLSFRTLPPSSNGVAHILEHTVLTGSDKFPVKDPFFSMNRRSLNTFMNALTGADFTCYPAASQVEQDFYNLLGVYLDAVFHPLLTKLSFAQEGHRLEFTTPNSPDSPLEYKGIVYNEMKGSLSSPTTRLNEAISEALFPNTPYGFNSGGDPRDIPKLTYDELVSFHKKYYHPSKCLFFFYGNLPLEKHLDFIYENALVGYKKEPQLEPIPKQPRFSKPVRKELFYPVSDEDTEDEEKTLISFAWLTTSILEQLEVLALSILDIILMDTDASILKLQLLHSGLCKQASSTLDTENAEVPYQITLKGSKAQDADELERILRETLLHITQKGIDEDHIASAMHQLELERSEIGQDGGPFGLSLFARSALMKQHGGKSEDGLRIHSLFEELRSTLQEKPTFFQDLLYKYFINNTHFLRIVMKPSKELVQQELLEERARLDSLQNTLTPQEAKKIALNAEELKASQELDDSEKLELLPKILLADVPKKGRRFELSRQALGNLDVFHHSAFTNHLIYLDLVFPMPEAKEEDLWFMRLFSILAPQVGSGTRSYTENLEYIQQHTGGIGVGFSLNQQVNDADVFSPSVHIKGKALCRKQDKLFQLFFDTAQTLNFTDRNRLKELIFKHFTNLQSALTQNALKYAATLSLSHLSQANHLSSAWSGLDYFYKVRYLAHNFDKEQDKLVSKLTEMQERLFCNQGAHLVVTCDQAEYSKYAETGFEGLIDLPLRPYTPWKSHFTLPKVTPIARLISTPVAFSAQAFKGLSYTNPESAALALASHIFDNVTLHKRIREQGGAYGGGSSYNPTSSNFYFYGYRDPNIATTVSAFDEAIKGVIKGNFDESDLEEAKLEMIQALDTPVPPGSRGDVAYSRLREGKTDEVRQSFRDRILNASCKDIQNVVLEHVLPRISESVLVTFAGRELVERENKKLKTPLQIEKI